MNALLDRDLHRVLARLPEDLLSYMSRKNTHLVVAGGFVRDVVAGEEPKDIDVFGDVGELYPAFELLANGRGAPGVHRITTERSFTLLDPLGKNIQFITTRLFPDPRQHIEAFDFRVCQAGVWFDGDGFVGACSDYFYADLAGKWLVWTSPEEDPGNEERDANSLLRVLRFVKRGYRIDSSDLAKIVARVARPGEEYAHADIERALEKAGNASSL